MNKLLFSLLILIAMNLCTCTPVFPFDYFYGASQSTTESVISDYRHQKKTDSSFDHNNLVKNATEVMDETFKESNAEFYAEIIGKLVGSVRSSFLDLFDGIRKRNQYFREKSERNEAHKTMEELNKSLNVIMTHLSMKNNITDESEEIARITKRNDNFLDDDKVGASDEIPINLNQFDDSDLISNEDYTISETSQPPHDDSSLFARYYDLYEQLKLRHHNRKNRKIQKFLRIILTPILLFNETDANNLNFDNDLTFKIIQNNQTIARLTPFEIIRILHQESNDRIQVRMKTVMKRIFYKYVRLYLIARRNFKNPHANYRDVRNVDIDDGFKLLNDNEISEEEGSGDDEDGDDVDIEVITNDGRKNFQSLEAFAILMLEIFGTIFALTVGLWSHIEGGFFFDLLE